MRTEKDLRMEIVRNFTIENNKRATNHNNKYATKLNPKPKAKGTYEVTIAHLKKLTDAQRAELVKSYRTYKDFQDLIYNSIQNDRELSRTYGKEQSTSGSATQMEQLEELTQAEHYEPTEDITVVWKKKPSKKALAAYQLEQDANKLLNREQ